MVWCSVSANPMPAVARATSRCASSSCSVKNFSRLRPSLPASFNPAATKLSNALILPAARISPIREAAASTDSGACSASSSMICHQRARLAPVPRIRRAMATATSVAAAACAPALRQILAAVCAATISEAMPSSVGWLRLLSQNATRQEGPALTSASASTPAAQPSSSSASKRVARSSQAVRNKGRSASRCRISKWTRRTAPSGPAEMTRNDPLRSAALTGCRPRWPR